MDQNQKVDSENYRKYIEELKKIDSLNIAIAISIGNESYGRVKSISLGDVAGTADDNHFLVSVITPMIQKMAREISEEYKAKYSIKSFTSQLLGPEVSKKLDELGSKVKAEYKRLFSAPKPKKEDKEKVMGFIGRNK